ncbi:hypothetical protein GOV10_04210 [Candidatus Woesearchaeota archaeon]|nr:hypothetical protein [Candidatus Woesearchaeota archaeon]
MADSKIKKGNIQSFLHEGLLAIMMENLLGEVGHGNKRGVLQVREKDTSKEYIVDSNENYILKHKGRSNFILLEKEATPVGRKRYQMEKESYMATEIDGLGYLINDPSHLLIGEAAKGTEFKLNAWGAGHKKNVYERLFNPMKELFSDHQLIYLVLTRKEVIFDNGTHLTTRAENLYKKLKEINVDTLFVPTPETDPSLEELAIRSHERLNIIRGQIGHRLV